jgi:hypothetical protein
MYVVTFENYFLTPRYDGEKWTQARIEESSSETGPWITLETQPIPDYPDPTNPPAQSFTTELALIENGWYRLVFLDATGDTEQPTTPLRRAIDGQQPIMCTVAEVANWIHARTKDKNGNEIGTFTDDTRPTDDQVTNEIVASANDVTMFIDTDIPEAAYELAQEVVSLGAACRIELSFFPEQVGTDRSAYDRLKTYYDEMLLRLQDAVEREALEEVEGETPAYGIFYNFPVHEPNWDTVIW